jgi:exodeoxyribonuclease VII small subunit
MSTNKTMKRPDELSFEEAFRELEETVKKLEAGDLSLDESLTLFEHGTQLAQRCSEMLDQAELRLSQLVPTASGGYTVAPISSQEEQS